MSMETKLLTILSHRLVESELELLVKLPSFSTAKWVSKHTVVSLGVHQEQLVERYLKDPRNQVRKELI